MARIYHNAGPMGSDFSCLVVTKEVSPWAVAFSVSGSRTVILSLTQAEDLVGQLCALCGIGTEAITTRKAPIEGESFIK